MSKLFFFFICLVGVSGALIAQDAQTILGRMDETLFPSRYHSVMTLTTTKPDKADSSMKLDILYRKGTGSLMEILSPARVKGTRLLQKEQGLWLYSPNSESSRALRLSPKQSFQGSVFSNGDVSEPHFAQDYSAKFAGEDFVEKPGLGKVKVQILEARPQTAQAQYGMLKIWIQSGTSIPLRIEYTAKSGLLFKRMDFSDFKHLAGTLRPTTFKMESFEEPGAYTVLTLSVLEERPEIPENLFSETALTR